MKVRVYIRMCISENASVCLCLYIYKHYVLGSARGVMIIVVENGFDDTSSNPGQDWLHFT